MSKRLHTILNEKYRPDTLEGYICKDEYKAKFQEFIDQYQSNGFESICREDDFMVEMEQKLTANKQFFYKAALLKVQKLFTSAGSEHILGLSPEKVDTATFFVVAHPEDQGRLNHAQERLYQLGQELYLNKSGVSVVSIHTRQRTVAGHYIDLLLQTYSFYADVHNTVFTFVAAIQLEANQLERKGFHFYAGKNAAMFRLPDKDLLNEGHTFSTRELDILKLIAEGAGSEQIADKLCLSVNTVNTHRRNILKKANMPSTQDLVMLLKEKGIL